MAGVEVEIGNGTRYARFSKRDVGLLRIVEGYLSHNGHTYVSGQVADLRHRLNLEVDGYPGSDGGQR